MAAVTSFLFPQHPPDPRVPPAMRKSEAQTRHFLATLAGLIPAMQSRAVALDAETAFPTEDIAILTSLGAFTAPLPTALGGLGLGTEFHGARPLMDLLRLLGRANLSLGRLIEAHINAIRLITHYGTPAQAQDAAEAARAGHLFALWVTDAPGEPPLTLTARHTLEGAKAPCSGAGHATRALVTAETPAGTVMLAVSPPPGARASHEAWRTTGMRAAANGRMELTGLTPGAPIGAPGDYLRQPDFSAGAWRTSAVTLGGLEALTAAFRAALAARSRTENPHQRARVGEALIAQETARLWIRRAAHCAENPDADPGDTAAIVNLARIAAETATLAAIQIVQRGLGMAAFREGTLTALLFRDLAIYLRQPAPDETLTEAAAHFMQREMPEGLLF